MLLCLALTALTVKLMFVMVVPSLVLPVSAGSVGAARIGSPAVGVAAGVPAGAAACGADADVGAVVFALTFWISADFTVYAIANMSRVVTSSLIYSVVPWNAELFGWQGLFELGLDDCC